MERTEAWSKGQILAHPPKKLKKTLTHTSIGVRICIGLFCFAAFLVFGTSWHDSIAHVRYDRLELETHLDYVL